MSDQEDEDNDAGHKNPQNLMNQIQQLLEPWISAWKPWIRQKSLNLLPTNQLDANTGQTQKTAQTGQQPGTGETRQQQLVVPVLVPSSLKQDAKNQERLRKKPIVWN